MDDLRTPGFMIIAILGTIVTFGLFLVYSPKIFKKQICWNIIAQSQFPDNTTSGTRWITNVAPP